MPVCCGDSTPCPLPKAEVTFSQASAKPHLYLGLCWDPSSSCCIRTRLSHARPKPLARASLRQADVVCPWGRGSPSRQYLPAIPASLDQGRLSLSKAQSLLKTFD